jgi:8-oxo-dGTP diphosphatase
MTKCTSEHPHHSQQQQQQQQQPLQEQEQPETKSQKQPYPRVGVGVVVVSSFPTDVATTTTSITTSATDTTNACNSPSLSSLSSSPTSSGIWVGRRRGSHGCHTLALPGGHLEMYESWSDCAIREVYEEMGITLSRVEFLHVTNDIMIEEEKHYITVFMIGHYDATTLGEPRNCEPNKCDGWELYTLPQLQNMIGTKELFIPLEHLLHDSPQSLVQKLTERYD